MEKSVFLVRPHWARAWMMYNKTVLENGAKIISEQLDHIRSISLGIWVNVGSRDEESWENGISHFIEHMSFKGTRNRTGLQISKALDAIGGLSNAFTGKEDTCFSGRVLGKHFHLLADILSDPQTSGGLLIAMPEDRASGLLERMQQEGITEAAIIGEVVAGLPGKIRID